MKKSFTTILVAISLLMINAHPSVCQESQRLMQTPSTEQSTQSAQSTSARQTSPVRLDEKAQKIKRTVEKIGVGGRLTLYLKNGEQLYGSLVRYDAESLQITEVDLKQVVTVQYGNIKKVREDYGKPNIFTGKRNNPPKGAKIAVTAAALALVLALPLILVATMKD